MRVTHTVNGAMLASDEARMQTQARDRQRLSTRAEEWRIDEQRLAHRATHASSERALRPMGRPADATPLEGGAAGGGAASERLRRPSTNEDTHAVHAGSPHTPSGVFEEKAEDCGLLARRKTGGETQADDGENRGVRSCENDGESGLPDADAALIHPHDMRERVDGYVGDSSQGLTVEVPPDERVLSASENPQQEVGNDASTGIGGASSGGLSRPSDRATERVHAASPHAVVLADATADQRWSMDVTLDNGMTLAFSKSGREGAEGRVRLHGDARLSSESRIVLQTRLQAHGFRLESDAHGPSSAGKNRGDAS